MSARPHKKSASQEVSVIGGFFGGGIAACGAVTITNPIEVVKTRMQLQGELSAKNAHVPRPYKNPIQGVLVVYRNEGIKGCQRGLVSAWIYQLGLNGCRLGLYEPIRNTLNRLMYPSRDPHTVQNTAINVISGAVSGAAGATVGSPLFLVKTRMQSYSNSIQIGQQTHYRGVWNGLSTIYRQSGFMGLFQGVDAAIIRTAAGSSVQLPIYNFAKHELLKNQIMEEGTGLHLTSSLFAGIGVSVVMNPWDVILTRIYNQKTKLYSGPLDCLIKIVKVEGIMALYKGFEAQILRVAPHTILCLVFMEQTMKLVKGVEMTLFSAF